MELSVGGGDETGGAGDAEEPEPEPDAEGRSPARGGPDGQGP